MDWICYIDSVHALLLAVWFIIERQKEGCESAMRKIPWWIFTVWIAIVGMALFTQLLVCYWVFTLGSVTLGRESLIFNNLEYGAEMILAVIGIILTICLTPRLLRMVK